MIHTEQLIEHVVKHLAFSCRYKGRQSLWL